jgi:HSP20 family protein
VSGRIKLFIETARFRPSPVEAPLVDIYETDGSLVFEMDLPGIDPGDVRVRVERDLLFIEGAKRCPRPDRGAQKYIQMERSFSGFRRVMRFPVSVEEGSGKAVYRDGVLRVSFLKARPREIRIEIDKE